MRKWEIFVMNDSVITCDEVIDIEQTNFDEENIAYKTQNFYTLLAFLLITIALLIVVSIYCYLIKYQEKQKHLFPFSDTNLKQVFINNIN